MCAHGVRVCACLHLCVLVCECVCTQGQDNTVTSVLLRTSGSSLRGGWEVFSWLHVLLEVSNHWGGQRKQFRNGTM